MRSVARGLGGLLVFGVMGVVAVVDRMRAAARGDKRRPQMWF